MRDALLHKPQDSDVDGISVVVCTYNGVTRLTPTLMSIFQQKTRDDIDWEILVVDNASSDGTQEFCFELKNKHKFEGTFRVVSESTPGLNYARRRGLEEAKHNVVLFCDDDNHLFEDYIQTGFDLFAANSKIGALGGMGLPLFESKKPDWYDDYQHSFAVGAQHSRNGKINAKFPEVYGAGCFFYKPILKNLFDGGFQTIMSDRKGKSLSSGGDVEWCYLIHLKEYEIWFSDQLKFYHLMPEARLTWDYYIKLKSGIGRGAALLFSYQFYFEKGNLPSLVYLFHYLLRWSEACATCFFVLTKNLLKFGNKNENKKSLGIHILKAKAISFSMHWLASVKHYQQIKSQGRIYSKKLAR